MRNLTEKNSNINWYFKYKLKMSRGYKEYIKKLAKDSKNTVFINSSAEHASVVLSTIFENAKNYVKLYAGNLRGPVSRDLEYRTNLDSFLRRKGQLMIILEDYQENLPLNNADLLRFYSLLGRVTIKYSPDNFVNNDHLSKIHFCVADDKMYRIETDTENFLAKGSFNDNDTSIELSSLFDKIFKEAETVDVKNIN